MKHEFQHGNQHAVGHGRPSGKSVEVRLREARAKAVDTLITAVESGDVAACAAVVDLNMRASQ